jgi:peroxiredoxin Q/BCP
MKRLFHSVAIVSFALCLFANPLRGEVAVGDTAPAFELEGSDGKSYSSEQFKGNKVMVIAWFPKAFTGGCTKECKSMRENGELLRSFDVAYFTASVDDVAKNTEFAKSLELDYPILSDPEKTVATAFGVLNDRGVTNRWTYYIGKDGKVLYVDKSVKADSHGQDIAAKLKELGVASK